MRITWTIPLIGGTITWNLSDERVMESVEALTMLGFEPTVSIDDTTEGV